MNVQQIIEKRDKRLSNYSYKLIPNQYGLDVSFPEDEVMDINESEMSVVIPFADGNRRDGVGDLLEIGGIRTERHRVNPIVLFDHGKQVQLPIGLAEDPRTGEYTVQLDQNRQKAFCKAFFYQGKSSLGVDDSRSHDHSLFCEQMFDLICKRFIRAGSIGYQVIQAKELPPNYETGAPKGLHLLSTLMLEASAVVLPANQDTVRKALCMGKVCGKPLSPMLVKSLTPYASTKELKVGFSDVVPVPHGEKINTTKIPPVSWKPGVGAKKKFTKDIGDIRLKYKKTDNLRRRMKRSATGSSMIYVKAADLDALQQESKSANVQFSFKGTTSSGYAKVKLSGADSDIDGIAKKYGRILKSKMQYKQKALDTSKERHMPPLDDPKAKKPGMTPPPPVEELEEEVESEEPYGASVLRRIHEDHRILMNDYDQLLKPLENENVRSHLQKILEHIEEVLSLTEDIFASTENYKGLDPLEGGMNKEEGMEEGMEEDDTEETDPDEMAGAEDAVAADSEPSPEPEPEEVVEGMKQEKALRMKYRKKSLCKECGRFACKCGGEGKNMDEGMPPEENMQEGASKEEGAAYSKALENYEKEAAMEAHDYLKELTSANDYGDEHRMKSYHFHKVLGKIGGIEDEHCKKYYALKSIPGGQEWMEEEEAEHDGLHPHRKLCGDASSYFKGISTERAFGDGHREEADALSKAMSEIFAENKEEKSSDVDGNSPDMENEANDGTKKLKDLILKQNKELEELSRKFQSLSL